MICTWKGCNKKAVHIQINKNGKQWANLCKKHHDMLNKDIQKLFSRDRKCGELKIL